jgi:hypothetical protein
MNEGIGVGQSDFSFRNRNVESVGAQDKGQRQLSMAEQEKLEKEVFMAGRSWRIDETEAERKARAEEEWQQKWVWRQLEIKRLRGESEQLQGESEVRQLEERENKFDERKAKQVLEVVKDWVKYDGGLYSHMTGKALKLEAGVDYKVDAEGYPDMNSYREARDKMVEEWLANPSNEKWLSEAMRFNREHMDKDLWRGKKTVSERKSDGSVEEKERYATPYFYENNWLYYESNFFDEVKGERVQPERERTKYRVYFNVEGSEVISSFEEIINRLSQDEQLQKFGFQIKTAEMPINVERGNYGEVVQLMNQKDKIVLYLGDKGIERALPILRKYAQENRSKFEQQGVLLAQSLTDDVAQEIPGVSVTSETKGKDPNGGSYQTFSEMQTRIIESSLNSLVSSLKKPEGQEWLRINYPMMRDNLVGLPEKTSSKDYVRVILASSGGEDFLQKQLRRIYPLWAKSFGVSENNIAFKRGERKSFFDERKAA